MPACGEYSVHMEEQVCFADPELPFHVWVREPAGPNGYRWVLRETSPPAQSPATAGEVGSAPEAP